MVLKIEEESTTDIENFHIPPMDILIFMAIFGLKDLADPPHFSPEIGATETLKKSPETAETMASLATTTRWIVKPKEPKAGPCRMCDVNTKY